MMNNAYKPGGMLSASANDSDPRLLGSASYGLHRHPTFRSKKTYKSHRSTNKMQKQWIDTSVNEDLDNEVEEILIPPNFADLMEEQGGFGRFQVV